MCSHIIILQGSHAVWKTLKSMELTFPFFKVMKSMEFGRVVLKSMEFFGDFFNFSSHTKLLCVSILKRKKWINVVYKLHPKRLESFFKRKNEISSLLEKSRHDEMCR